MQVRFNEMSLKYDMQKKNISETTPPSLDHDLPYASAMTQLRLKHVLDTPWIRVEHALDLT